MVGGDIDPVIPSKGVGFHAYFLLLFFVFPFRLTICVHVCVRVCVVWSLFKNSFGRGINRTARRRRRRKVGGSSSPAFMMKMQLPFSVAPQYYALSKCRKGSCCFCCFCYGLWAILLIMGGGVRGMQQNREQKNERTRRCEKRDGKCNSNQKQGEHEEEKGRGVTVQNFFAPHLLLLPTVVLLLLLLISLINMCVQAHLFACMRVCVRESNSCFAFVIVFGQRNTKQNEVGKIAGRLISHALCFQILVFFFILLANNFECLLPSLLHRILPLTPGR